MAPWKTLTSFLPSPPPPPPLAFWDDFRHPVPALSANPALATCAAFPWCSLCAEATGAFWLAEAGRLDGKEATTYWRFFSSFAERFPRVHLNQDKHLTDADNLYCAGGPTSACDL